MCGIAGIVNFKNFEDKEPTLHRMAGYLRHRGPDAAGFYSQGPVGLAHTRLSIIDLTSGNQPIHNEDQSIWVIFNGEIFNYPELKCKLQSRGHQFYTQTDTEILVHMYEEYNTKMFSYLNGQFALALWDIKTQTLLLGRDRMGIRPLFYFHAHNRLVFASEIKAIFADQTIPRKLDTQNLSDLFTCWSTMAHGTSFQNIFQLEPGHYALFSKQGMSLNQYWELPFGKTSFRKESVDELAYELNHLIMDAARIRLRADVSVGAYLSGGLDSTYTSALVKNNFNNKLCSFSVGFTNKNFDESPYQNRAVEHLGTNHKTINCSHDDIGNVFPKVIWHTETPILRTAPAPLLILSNLVKKNNFKVVLTGEGADEIFAGYNIFKADKVRRFWAKFPDSRLRPRLLEKLYPYVFSQKNSKSIKFLEEFFKKGLEDINSPVYSHIQRWESNSHLKIFFSENLKQQSQGIEDFVKRYCTTLPDDYMDWDPLSRAQYCEIKIFLSNYLLSSQGDRMSMANSIEGRYPFLDHRVVEFAASLPPMFRMNGITEKYILKHSARGMVLDELIERPKQPYRAPMTQAFLGNTTHEYVHDLLSETAIKNAGYFDHKKTNRLVKKCQKQGGTLLSERENMALIGILSTQLLDFQFINNFPAA
ncbi:asparagine synthase (glutamine-hydrolysing) [Desulfocicer vacuolatum DSM 3385]|uniref:asparagine synthase (glutamine-hydrolyzing) n=1 Tax=Desulfocicer vacuolatum DSM 3385 TaxID=1121400 RepID=A0A1W2D4X5_9BACT|nr:asparagine synthase (glutamine-hydrolyzing) [Desulfocicer vacuolatum]SMC92509.1 asparagine synthase (glutamine-hydrolysing) [Desulfocicer vacuolatum DSM 3385]